MAFEKVKRYFDSAGLGDRVKVLEESSATVELAAEAVGCEPKQIAKTLSFLLPDPCAENPDGNMEEGSGCYRAILIVTAGDAKVDNKKYKAYFHQKAKMIPGDEVEKYIGHAPGGVCPFETHPGVKVYLDESLKRFEIVYPAAGSGHSAVELSLEELEQHAHPECWIDVCKGWE